MRPNILWIVFDTARADALEPYGAPPGASPAVADLARRGAAHDGVHSTACWTLPAHVSKFAGGLPRALGFADIGGLSPPAARPGVEALKDRLLPEVLRRDGYRTQAVSANPWVSEVSGFATGFDDFVDVAGGRDPATVANTPRARLRWTLEVVQARVDDGAAAAQEVLCDWLAAGGHEPTFRFVNLVECHSPYLPPRPYSDVSLRDRLRAGAEAREHLTMMSLWRASVTGRVPPDDALARMRALYAGAVRYMDDWLAAVLEALDAAGRLDDTLVLLTSDHGENFGEDDLMAHCFSLDQRLIRVPLVAAGPGADRLAGIRSIAEIPGRLADVAGVAEHPYDSAALPPLPVAQFDTPARGRHDEGTRKVIEWWSLDETGLERLLEPIVATVDGTVKRVARGGEEVFYDLAADPLELAPLTAPAVDAPTAARLRASADHPAAQARASTWSDANGGAEAASGEDAAELEDRMRLLGYL